MVDRRKLPALQHRRSMGLYGSPELHPKGSMPTWQGPPPRRPRGFWTGVILGAGAVLALEAVLVLGHGAANQSGLQSTAVPMAAASNTTSYTATTLSPSATVTTSTVVTLSGCPPGAAVCGESAGVTVSISNINRNYQLSVPSNWAAQASPKRGFHWIRFELTLTVSSGQHDLEPGAFTVSDAVGVDLALDFAPTLDPNCKSSAAGGVYGPGETLGPMPVCMQVAGPVNGPLTLGWSPGPTDMPVNIKLP